MHAMKHVWVEMYSCIHCYPSAGAVRSASRSGNLIPIKYPHLPRGGWVASEPVWTLWTKDKFLDLERNRNAIRLLSSLWLNRRTDYAILAFSEI